MDWLAVLTGIASGVGSSLVTSRLQYHYWTKQRDQQRKEEREFWRLQRGDEQRLEAINQYNKLSNAYIAACVTQIGEPPAIDVWIRDINIAAGVIQSLFSQPIYEMTKKISDKVTPYADWAALQIGDRRKRGDELIDLVHAALKAMYQEVVGLPSEPPLP